MLLLPVYYSAVVLSFEAVLHQYRFCVSDALLQTGFCANSSTDMIGKSITATGNTEI